MQENRIPVLLIEDNRLLREGIAAIVVKQPDLRLTAALARLDTALLRSPETRPDLVLLDAALRDADSLGVVRTVKLVAPQARIIVMGLLPSEDDIMEFVRAGVSGFILKEATLEEFVQTLHAVVRGENVLPRETTGTLFSQIATDAVARGEKRALAAVRMTPREREVVTLICGGLSNREIAQRLHISNFTVKSHVHNILEKLAVRTRLQIATYASRGLSAAIAGATLALTY
jgi:two-component system NarL family response regulator